MRDTIPWALAGANSCQIGKKLGLFVLSYYVTGVKGDQSRENGFQSLFHVDAQALFLCVKVKF